MAPSIALSTDAPRCVVFLAPPFGGFLAEQARVDDHGADLVRALFQLLADLAAVCADGRAMAPGPAAACRCSGALGPTCSAGSHLFDSRGGRRRSRLGASVPRGARAQAAPPGRTAAAAF